MRVDYSLFFGFVFLIVFIEGRSVTLLDNEDAEILGEDTGLKRKVIAPLLTEEEIRTTEPRRTFQLNLRPARFEATKIDADTQVDEYSEDPFESKEE